jgi:integrase
MAVKGLFQKPNGKWFLIRSKGYDPLYRDGKGGYPQEWIDLHTTDEEEAKKKAKIIRGKIAEEKYRSPERATLNELLERWLKHCNQKGLKRRTIEEYEKLVKTHIKDGLGKMSIKDIKAKHIRELIELKESQYTRKKIYIVLNAAYKLGMADDDLEIQENPCTRVLTPTVKKVTHTVWTAAQAKRFLEEVRFTREYGIFLCCLTTGMRIGEVLGLRWSDINEKEKTITIRQTLEEKIKGNPEPQFGTPKTDASKAPLLMTDVLLKEIQRIKVRQKEEKLKAGKLYKDYDLIFANFTGRPVHLENLRNKYFLKAIKDINAKLVEKGEEPNFPKIRLHDMRHSAATMLRHLGVDIKTIQRYLRHADLATTSETYVHDDDVEILREATKAIEKALS